MEIFNDDFMEELYFKEGKYYLKMNWRDVIILDLIFRKLNCDKKLLKDMNEYIEDIGKINKKDIVWIEGNIYDGMYLDYRDKEVEIKENSKYFDRFIGNIIYMIKDEKGFEEELFLKNEDLFYEILERIKKGKMFREYDFDYSLINRMEKVIKNFKNNGEEL